MPFTPNDYVLDQLITLIKLWKDKSSNSDNSLTESGKKMPNSMSTKKFLSMIKGGLSKEMLIKYWENIPAIQSLLDKPNFDEVTLLADEPEPDAETDEAPLEPVAPEDQQLAPPDAPLDDQIPGTDMAEPGAPSTSAPMPAEEPTQTGPSSADVVARMAKRRRDRVTEQYRRYLRKHTKMLQ